MQQERLTKGSRKEAEEGLTSTCGRGWLLQNVKGADIIPESSTARAAQVRPRVLGAVVPLRGPQGKGACPFHGQGAGPCLRFPGAGCGAGAGCR